MIIPDSPHPHDEGCGSDNVLLECPSGFFEMPLYEPAHMTDVSCRSLQSDSERTHTLSPILSRSTFEPTATTTPAPSSPRSTGYVVVYNPVSWIFQSSGFKPAASTLSRTSSRPGEGTLTVRTAKAPPFDRRWSTFCCRGRDIALGVGSAAERAQKTLYTHHLPLVWAMWLAKNLYAWSRRLCGCDAVEHLVWVMWHGCESCPRLVV